MKKKLGLILFTCIVIFSCKLSLSAATSPVIGFVECKYKFNDPSKMDTDYADNGIMSFYYTELNFKGSDAAKTALFTKNKQYDSFTNVSGLGTTTCKTCFSSGYATKNSHQLFETFKPEFENNGGKCPKYLVLKDVGGNKYTPYFTNNMSEYCDGTNCPLTANNISGGDYIPVYPGEREWTFTSSGEGSCANANVKIFIDGTLLKAKISYPKTSTWYDSSAKKEVTVNVGFGVSQEGSTQLKYIYNLLKNGKIEKFFIRGDAGHEKVEFNDGGWASGSCTFHDGITTSPQDNCTRYKDIETELNRLKKELDNASSKLNTLANDNLTCTSSDCTPKDVSNITDINTLKDKAQKINQFDKEDYLKKYNAYLEALTKAYEEACSEDKETIKNLMTALNSNNETYQKKISGLTDYLKKVSERLTELGEEEAAKEVDQFVADNEEFLKQIRDAHSLLDGTINIDFKEGCDMLSPDLKNWLISLLDFIKMGALVLTVILSMVDFVKAAVSSESDAMKKVWNRFARRLLIVAMLFLMPLVIKLILGIASINGVDASNPFCDIQ